MLVRFAPTTARAIGIEAISRGCEQAHFVEMDPWVRRILYHFFSFLFVPSSTPRNNINSTLTRMCHDDFAFIG